MKAFFGYALRRYRCKRHQILFDTDYAFGLLDSARECTLNEDTLGENHGTYILIQRGLDQGTLVATLVHEALHNWCYVRGRPMGEEAEHYCMDKLLRM